MINKPPQNWSDSDNDKAIAAAHSGIAAAQYATTATKRGYSLLKGVGLGLIAALWGFAGTAHFALGGLGSRSASGAGLMTILLAAIPGYFAWRNFKKAFGSDANERPKASYGEVGIGWGDDSASNPGSRAPFGLNRSGKGDQFAQEPPKFNKPRGAARCAVQNSQAQLIKSLLFGVALIPLGVYLLQAGNPVVKILGLFTFICGPVIVLKTVRGLIGAVAAFSYDEEGITMPGWFGDKHLAWRDLSDFSIKTVSTYAYGIVKTSSNHSLYAVKTGGGKTLLPTQFTGLDADGLSKLAAQLELCRSGAAGTRSRFSKEHSPVGSLPSPAFGAINTHLTPTAPTFGRRQGVFADREP